jgi:NDP-sugar pyrophosphorylase family protein
VRKPCIKTIKNGIDLSRTFKENTMAARKQADTTEAAKIIVGIPEKEMPPNIDVVIPLGPSEIDRDKMFPLSLYVPKPLFLVGVKPMIWRILEQISEIESSIQNIFLLIQKQAGNNDGYIVEKYLRDFKGLPIFEKLKFEENEDRKLCDRISRLDFKCDNFLVHFDDILLPKKSRLFKQLLDFHLDEEKGNGIWGTLAYSQRYPLEIGLIKKSDKENRMYSLEEKSPQTLGKLMHKTGPSIEEVCINMAISIFNKKILDYLKDKDNNFYANIGKLEKDRLAIYDYKGEWFHIDSIHDLHEQHIHKFEDWKK